MPRTRRLNLEAIENSLRTVQRDFDVINTTLSTPRDPLSDEVLDWMMIGYQRVDALVRARVDPYAIGNSAALLELNLLVLCGDDQTQMSECAQLVKATRTGYYVKGDGGIEALLERMKTLYAESVWRRVASAYIHMLSQPQLFIEGNHRTGALLMSWMLALEGKPPFVLSVENAKAYFDPSALAKNARKRSMQMMLERPKLMKRFAELLKREADKEHVKL